MGINNRIEFMPLLHKPFNTDIPDFSRRLRKSLMLYGSSMNVPPPPAIFLKHLEEKLDFKILKSGGPIVTLPKMIVFGAWESRITMKDDQFPG